MNSRSAVHESRPSAENGRMQWRNPAVLHLIVATFLFWTSLYLYIPVLPGHARHLGATAVWIGLIGAAYGLSQVVLRLPMGIWSDRLGRRKPFVLVGCICAALSGVAFALAGDPLLLVAARALSGVAAATWLAFTVMYTAYFPRDRNDAMTVIVFVNTLGTLVGQVAGPLLSEWAGPMSVFWLSALLGTVSVGLALLAPEAKRDSSSAATPSVRDLVGVAGNRVVLTVSLLGAVSQYIAHGGTYVFVNDWAQQRLGATEAELGLLALVTTVPVAISTLAGGAWLAHRIGPGRVIAIGFVLSGLSAASVPLWPDLRVLYATQAIGGLARGFTLPMLMSLSLLAVPRASGASAVGFFQATYGFGMVAGPLLTGVIADSVGLAGGFWVMMAVSLFGALMAHLHLQSTGVTEAAPEGAIVPVTGR